MMLVTQRKATIQAQFRYAAAAAQADAGARTLRFTFATSNVCRDGDRILPGAWQLDNFRKNPVFLYGHDASRPPIGRVTEIAERDGKLIGAVRFGEDEFADLIFQKYKTGEMSAVSVSWLPIESRPARGPGRAAGSKDFTKCELLEISAVSLPADPNAVITGRAAELGERMAAVRALAAPKNHEPPFRSLGEQLQAIVRIASGYDPRLVRAPTGAGEVDPAGGGFLLQEAFAQDLVQSLYSEAVIAPLCDRRTAERIGNYVIPAVDEKSRADGSRSGGALAYWLAEGVPVSASFPKFRAIKFISHKLIAACVVTNELLQDAEALESRLTDIFASELSFQLDRQILLGTGAGAPLGIVNAPATIVVAKETGQAAATILPQNILNAWARMAAPSRARAVWLMNEDALAQIDSGSPGGFSGIFIPAGAAGNALPLLKGRPIITVEQAPALGQAGDIACADLTQYCVISRLPAFAISAHAMFVNDQTVFRFVLRCDGKPKWVSPITPFNGSATRSPFVTLAPR